jgi:PKD repeat protein
VLAGAVHRGSDETERGRERAGRRAAVLAAVALVACGLAEPAAAALSADGEEAGPSVSLTSPDQRVVSGTISLDAETSGDAVRVDYLVDGTLVAYDASASDWGEVWDTKAVADGDHVFVARARDAAGSTTTSAPVTVAVNNVPDTSPPPAAPGNGNPLTCEGYPERRIFLEAQSWWVQTPGKAGTDFGHLHVATCFPWAQDLTGTVHFDVRIVMHKNPGVFRQLRIQIFNAAPDTVSEQELRCPEETCTWWFPIEVNTATATKDGCQEFRIQAHVDEPDGNRALATNGWRANLVNGDPVDDYCDFRGFNFVEGRGWYGDFGGEEFGYENGRLEDPLPTAPISGVWAPHVKMGPGAGGIPTTYHSVHVDPNFHHDHHGVVLEEGPGKFDDELPIDTRLLADGAHRLVLRTDADTDTGSTLSGLLVIPFTVANGGSPPPPPEDDHLAADFSASPTSGQAPLDVAFTDASMGSPTSWSWSFGDGASSSERSPTHVYSAPGSYTVTLTVANAEGATSTTTRADYVNVSESAPPPDADTAAPSVTLMEPAADAVVSGMAGVDASASDDVGVTRVDYLLDGAMVASDATAPSWDEPWDSTTAADGSHTIVARAWDEAGNAGLSAPVTISVDNLPEPPPADPLGCTITGTAGNDVLNGTPGPDVICALEGKDLVKAGNGDDVVYGGPGDDTLYGEGGNDVLVGGAGKDKLVGGAGADTLFAEEASGSFDLARQSARTGLFAGATGGDLLDGGDGADFLVGSRWKDRLVGGAGADRLHARGGPDLLVGGEGRDGLFGEGGSDTALARDGSRDRVVGGSGKDRAQVDRRFDRLRSVEARL